MRLLMYGCLFLFLQCPPAAGAAPAPRSLRVDLCIYGGTASGVIAAYAAARCGKSVLLIEPGPLIGGMTTGGLGQTDIGNKQAITGLSRQFYEKIGAHYGVPEKWTFEPHVALAVLQDYLRQGRITVWKQTQLLRVQKEGTVIKTLVLRSAGNGPRRKVQARQFLDCSYEGDLLAKAGVSYALGREGNATYHETLNGYHLAAYHKQSGGHQFPDGVSPYKEPGNPSSGLLWGISSDPPAETGTADKRIQAYNFRICLTDSAENRIPITRPEGYDPARYELLVRLFNAQPSMRKISQYFIWSRMPNRKTDINNRGGFSTDMIGMNYAWPEASYRDREKIFQAHMAYTKGLLYFLQTDPRVPAEIRTFIQAWGYPKDEYEAFGHFTPILYVREGRRMIGEYVMTEHNCRGDAKVNDGVGLAAYTMDSHNCQRIVVNGMVKNEGNVEVGGFKPYPIAYRALTPRRTECTNLLVPVCLSASHIAYGSIRMEPVFMVLGQSAALAAVMAMDRGVSVQEVPVDLLQRWLNEDPVLDKDFYTHVVHPGH